MNTDVYKEIVAIRTALEHLVKILNDWVYQAKGK